MSDTPETGSIDPVAAFDGLLDLEDRRAEQPALDDRSERFAGPDEDPATGEEGGAIDPEATQDATRDATEDATLGPAIDPPQSWSAEAKARFRQLPPDLQAVVAERASEQDRTFARRMSDVAEQRKAAEAERQATATERAQYARSLETVRQMLTQAAPQSVDWDAMAREDPAGYIAAMHAEGQRQARLQAVEAEQQRLQHRHLRDQEAAIAQQLEQQHARLLEALPEWRDPARARADRAELRAYLIDAGYSDGEIAQAADHRAVLLARKAMAYDRLRAARPATEKRVVPPPAAQRPGGGARQSRGDERLDASLQLLKRTGRHQDAARIFERLI